MAHGDMGARSRGWHDGTRILFSTREFARGAVPARHEGAAVRLRKRPPHAPSPPIHTKPAAHAAQHRVRVGYELDRSKRSQRLVHRVARCRCLPRSVCRCLPRVGWVAPFKFTRKAGAAPAEARLGRPPKA